MTIEKGDKVLVRSTTSGQSLVGYVLKTSKVRRLLALPSVKLFVITHDLTGPKTSTVWGYPKNIKWALKP